MAMTRRTLFGLSLVPLAAPVVGPRDPVLMLDDVGMQVAEVLDQRSDFIRWFYARRWSANMDLIAPDMLARWKQWFDEGLTPQQAVEAMRVWLADNWVDRTSGPVVSSPTAALAGDPQSQDHDGHSASI